jgi:hypothetical protein
VQAQSSGCFPGFGFDEQAPCPETLPFMQTGTYWFSLACAEMAASNTGNKKIDRFIIAPRKSGLNYSCSLLKDA